MQQPELPAVDDLTEGEYEALAEQLPGAEEMTIEFAAVYYRHGVLHVEGPYPPLPPVPGPTGDANPNGATTDDRGNRLAVRRRPA